MKKLLLVFAKSSITINISQNDLNKHETSDVNDSSNRAFLRGVLLFYLLDDKTSEKIPQTSIEEELELYLHTGKTALISHNSLATVNQSTP